MANFDDIAHDRLGTFAEERATWENPIDNCGYEGLPRNVINAELNRLTRKSVYPDSLMRERERTISATNMFDFLQ